MLAVRNKLEKVLKQYGVETTIRLLCGWDTFCKVFKIESPMDFLHLFDDLEQVQSEEKEHWTLFRYKPKHNFMIYDRKNEDVYINYDEIWSFLNEKFGLDYSEIQGLIQEWLDEVNNLRGVTTKRYQKYDVLMLDEVNNLRGVTTELTNFLLVPCWMRSTI